jgi:hypothetical protein
MRQRVVGNAAMGRRHAPFKAFTRKVRFPGPADLGRRADPTAAENQLFQQARSNRHRLISVMLPSNHLVPPAQARYTTPLLEERAQ